MKTEITATLATQIVQTFKVLGTWMRYWSAASTEVHSAIRPSRDRLQAEFDAEDRRRDAIRTEFPNAYRDLVYLQRQAEEIGLAWSYILDAHQNAAIINYFQNPHRPSLISHRELSVTRAIRPETAGGQMMTARIELVANRANETFFAAADARDGTDRLGQYRRMKFAYKAPPHTP